MDPLVLAGDFAGAYPGEPRIVLEDGRFELRRQGRPPEGLSVAEGLHIVTAGAGEEAGDGAADVRARLDANRDERRDFLVRSARAVETLRSGLEFASQPEIDGALRALQGALRDLGVVSDAMDRLLRTASTAGLVATPAGPVAVAATFELARARALADAWRAGGSEVREIDVGRPG